ncbi:MAG TPA: hypothetical protein VFH45_01175 [Acidimicrobiales bacterium]|nr:hypothetical protein [Acidimicrobiales bacterium]
MDFRSAASAFGFNVTPSSQRSRRVRRGEYTGVQPRRVVVPPGDRPARGLRHTVAFPDLPEAQLTWHTPFGRATGESRAN